MRNKQLVIPNQGCPASRIFIPHTPEHSVVISGRPWWAGVQPAWHLEVGKVSAASSPPSAGQDLEEGFAELHVEGGIDDGVEGAVHIA